ncbi:MAG: RidA family protein [Planctomycetota bacterium]
MNAPIIPKYINSRNAPAAIGPYVHAIEVHGMLYCSGQVGIDPETGNLVDGGIVEQTRQALQNLFQVVSAGMASHKHIVKTTVYMTDLGQFAEMNATYEEMFGAHRPARATVQVSRLPKDALVEIDCIAVKP